MFISNLLGSPDQLGIPDNQVNTASIQSILNVVYMVAGVIAVIVLIIAGINYITSAGDTNKITKAKNTILFTVVGLIIIISAFAITNFVLDWL